MIVSTLVILFLLKLRFPRNTPISDVLRERYGQSALQGFRKFEQVSQKLAKKQLDLHFLKCCKTYNVYPNFLNFKLYKNSLNNSELYKSWQDKLLDLEIQSKVKEIHHSEPLFK